MQENKAKNLQGACVYLSGPMQYAADQGVEWRRKFIQLCLKNELEIDFIDPTNKPGAEEMNINEDKDYQIKLQEEGKYLELQEYVSVYRRADLRFVDISDFMVAVIDPKIHMCGTYEEIFLAEQQHKPCFFVCEGGLKKLPRWLFDVVDLDNPSKGTRCNVFTSIEDVVTELVLLNRGDLPMTNEWVLIRKYIEQIRLQNPNRRQSNFGLE